MKLFIFICFALPVAFVAFIVWVWVLVTAEAKEWDAFKVAHACRVVAKVDGSVFNTFSVSPKGQMVIGVGSTPDKTGWLCDDGVTYYK